MKLSICATALGAAIFFLAATPAQDDLPPGEELALRQDNTWTHLVVTLRNGRKTTFTRAEVLKVEYVTQSRGGGASGWMGRIWRVRESAPDGRYCDAVWTRQGSSNTFSGSWTCSWGARVSDTLTVQPLRGRAVKVLRSGVSSHYEGTLSSDGASIRGEPKWGPGTWSVKIE